MILREQKQKMMQTLLSKQIWILWQIHVTSLFFFRKTPHLQPVPKKHRHMQMLNKWCFCTFLSSFNTSRACSTLCSFSRVWISRTQATLRTYGLGLDLRSIPGSLSDLTIRELNNNSPLLPIFSASWCWRLLRKKVWLSKLLCLVSFDPMSQL